MARIWMYWLSIPHLARGQTSSANVDAYLDPPADALTEVALTSHQGGVAVVSIFNVNDIWGLADYFYYADRMQRVQVSLRAVGGPTLGFINNTGARLIVRENEGGQLYPPVPQQSMKSIVFDSMSGAILHTEEVVGSAERIAEFGGGKLDARAHDFVRKEIAYEGKFDVMPAPPDFGTVKDKSFKVDVKKKLLVPVEIKVTPVKKPK